MTIEEAVVAHLRATTEVVALVGQRIYRGKVPDGTAFPRVVYRLMTDADQKPLMGRESRQPQATVELDCQGQATAGGYADSVAVAGAVADANGGAAGGAKLRDYAARWMPPAGANRLWVKSCTAVERRGDQQEQPAAGEPKDAYTTTVVLTIKYNEIAF